VFAVYVLACLQCTSKCTRCVHPHDFKVKYPITFPRTNSEVEHSIISISSAGASVKVICIQWVSTGTTGQEYADICSHAVCTYTVMTHRIHIISVCACVRVCVCVTLPLPCVFMFV